jgi:hypothetical protein
MQALVQLYKCPVLISSTSHREALCYTPEGPRFNSQWGHRLFFFNWPHTSSLTTALGSTPPLKWVPGIFLGSKGRPASKADNLTAICEAFVYKIWQPLYILWHIYSLQELFKENKLRAFCPQAKYTDRATGACRRSQSQLLRIEGVAWSGQLIPMVVNLNFLDLEPLLFHSSSSSVILTRLSGHRSRPTSCQKIW